jgi:hypothetical protein
MLFTASAKNVEGYEPAEPTFNDLGADYWSLTKCHLTNLAGVSKIP